MAERGCIRRLALATLAALLGGAAAAAEPVVDRITWLAGDTVAWRGARPSDRLLDWLGARLPGITQERVVANAKRSWMLIERGEPVCHAGAVRSPAREALAYFSNTWPMRPPQLVVRRDRMAALPLDATGQVDLPALLADARLQGALVHGRSYGTTLDAQIAQRPAQAALNQVTAGDFGSNLAALLLQGRADYTIEYPSALAAVMSIRPEAVALASLPIRGAVDPVVVGVACPRTPWGLAAIRRIDAELGTPEGAAMLRELLLNTLSADSQRHYRDFLDAFYQRRSQPTPGL